MNAAEQAQAVYNKAKKQIATGKFTVQDEVVVALWELVGQQQSDLAKQDHKISLLESTEKFDFDSLDKTQDALAILNKVRYTH